MGGDKRMGKSSCRRGEWRWSQGALTIATLAIGVGGCATLKEIVALRKVDFAFDRVSDVRLAGIRLDAIRRYSDLAPADAGRLAAAVIAKKVPLDLVVHVRAENPKDNSVQARLIDMEWAFFIEDRKAVEGKLSGTRVLPPGTPVDIPVAMGFDAISLFQGGAQDLLDAALAVAGFGATTREIRLEIVPTISTDLGPIRYPDRIVLRREVGRR